MTKRSASNITYPKVAVQWLNQVLWFHQNFCLVDSELLRNRHLRQTSNRYLPPYDDTLNIEMITKE